MKRVISVIALSLLLVLSLALAACSPETTPTPTPAGSPTAAATPTPTVSANWWDKFGEPQYGGTITRRTTTSALSTLYIDPGVPMGGGAQLWYEKMFMPDWTLDREIFSFSAQWVPEEYCLGRVVERWEQTDPQTMVFTIHQGIYWQDRPPVNGREFTADDVQFNYDRILGTGSGFTEPNPFFSADLASVERVAATGKYTVEVKFKEASVLSLDTLMTNSRFGMASPEWVEQGDLNSWDYAVGTSPWLLADFEPSTSVTYSRNPNYWDTDERYPENQLPYADNLRSVAIDDMTTALAAMRTGQIDMLLEYNGPSLQQSQALAQSDPDINQAFWPREGLTLATRCDTAPFTDIKVRIALQMALNLDDIAESYYFGTVESTPVGLAHPVFTDWVTPYDQWPAALQAEYSFNPDRAKELLAEAGLAGGFSTNCITASAFDTELLQIVKAYFMDIGVDMEIEVFDMPVFDSLSRAGDFDQIACTTQIGRSQGPVPSLQARTTGHWQNFTFNNDPVYDAMFNEMAAAASIDEVKSMAKEMELYALEQHWTVNVLPIVNPVMWQPWIKGYSGEFTENYLGTYYARFWVDQEVKTSMGY